MADIKNEVSTIRTGLAALEPRVTRVEDDLSLLGKLYTPLLPSFEHSNVKTSRVGKKQNGKSRPLKVFLNSSSDVSTIMNKFSAESAGQVNRNFTVIKVYRDRTPRETEHLSRSDLNSNKD